MGGWSPAWQTNALWIPFTADDAKHYAAGASYLKFSQTSKIRLLLLKLSHVVVFVWHVTCRQEVASWGIIWRCCWPEGSFKSHSYVFRTRGIPRFSCEGRLFLIWKQSLLWMAGGGVSPPVPAGPLKTKGGREQWASHNVERCSAAAIAQQTCARM